MSDLFGAVGSLHAALDYHLERHTVLASNIAHVDTPGYHPHDLRRVDPKLWVSNGAQCWAVAEALDDIPHFPLLSKAQAKRLRRRDKLEIQAGKFLEHEAPDAKTALRY